MPFRRDLFQTLCCLSLAAMIPCLAMADPVRTSPALRNTDAPHTPAGSTAVQPDNDWWLVFGDPTLSALCQRATVANNRIQIAAANLRKARAMAGEATAATQPHVSASFGATQAGGPLINAAGTQGRLFNASASLAWELDVFSRLSDTRKAAALDARAQDSLLQSTRLLITADVARAYFNIRSLDKARDLVRSTAATYQHALELVSSRFQTGSVTELDVQRARVELTAIQSDLLALDEQRADREHELAVLVADTPTTFRLDEAAPSATVPSIPAGLPASLISRRPDIAAAQDSLMAAQLRMGVARRAWLPDISLTASGGYASPSLGDLLQTSAQSWGVGLLFSLPILDGGRHKARTAWSDADADSQAAAYRDVVLNSYREVEDQLTALSTLSGMERLKSVEVAAATRAVELARSRFDRGLCSQIEVIDAERKALAAQRAALDVKGRQLLATVGLIRALGGGWSDLPASLARN